MLLCAQFKGITTLCRQAHLLRIFAAMSSNAASQSKPAQARATFQIVSTSPEPLSSSTGSPSPSSEPAELSSAGVGAGAGAGAPTATDASKDGSAQTRIPRRGLLHGRSGQTIETPAVMLHSVGISAAYLTPDLVQKIPGGVVSTIHLGHAFGFRDLLANPGKKSALGPGIGDMFALKPHAMTFLTTRPEAGMSVGGLPLGQPAKGHGYSFETPHGRFTIHPQEYLQVVAACEPDLFAILAQEPPAKAPRKKHQAALEQNAEWLVETMKSLRRNPPGQEGEEQYAACPVKAKPPEAVAPPAKPKELDETVVRTWIELQQQYHEIRRGGQGGKKGRGGSGVETTVASSTDEEGGDQKRTKTGGAGEDSSQEATTFKPMKIKDTEFGGAKRSASQQKHKRSSGRSGFSPDVVNALRAHATKESELLSKVLGCTDKVSARKMRSRLNKAAHKLRTGKEIVPRTSTKSTTSKPADVVDILAGAGPALALAVVTGSTEPHTWAASANQVVKSAADGYILGFNSGRAADGSGDVFAGAQGRGNLQQALDAAMSVLNQQGLAKKSEPATLHVSQGAARSPHDVLVLVASGIDLIDSPLALDATRAHKALVFPLFGMVNVKSSQPSSGGPHADPSEGNADVLKAMEAFVEQEEGREMDAIFEEMSQKKNPTQTQQVRNSASTQTDDDDEWRGALFSSSGDGADARFFQYADLFGPPQIRCSVNAFDEKFELDRRPLVAGCSCYACRNHTRAYIYHLFNCKESLGFILLHIHNTHHMSEFMRTVRDALDTGKDGQDAADQSFWALYRNYNRLEFVDE